jgi:hypothetical protein
MLRDLFTESAAGVERKKADVSGVHTQPLAFE